VPFIEPISEEQAAGEVAERYAQDRTDDGYVANMTKAFSHRPHVLGAWEALKTSAASTMDVRRYELATLAAARRLKSSYCMLAHGNVLASHFYDAEQVRRIAADHRAAGLDEVDVAVMDLAEKVAGDASSVTQADIDRLRDLGLSDADIFDVVAVAAVRSFLTKTLDALGVRPDGAYAELDPRLREVLVVGRPIDDR
jgi:uncharacterized peroxidase-related enzyme